MLDPFFRQRSADTVADHESCRIAVGQHDQPLCFGKLTQQFQLIRLPENAETIRFNNGGIHHTAQTDGIVFSFYSNRFLNCGFHSTFPNLAVTISLAATSSNTVRLSAEEDFRRRSACANISRLSLSDSSDSLLQSRAAYRRRNALPL